jgi:hypothetical protein
MVRNKLNFCVEFEVLTAVGRVSWDIAPCSPLKVKQALLATRSHARFWLGLFFGFEDGGDMFHQNVG